MHRTTILQDPYPKNLESNHQVTWSFAGSSRIPLGAPPTSNSETMSRRRRNEANGSHDGYFSTPFLSSNPCIAVLRFLSNSVMRDVPTKSILGKRRKRNHRKLSRLFYVFGLILVWLLATFHSVLLFKNHVDNAIPAADLPHRSLYIDDFGEEDSIVHVIQTRFMQMQPSLIALANARLLLFQTFTLPSMQQQSNTRFLWIIRTDPDLNLRTMERLKQYVATVPNAVLVASNQNPEGFRGAAIDDITETSVLVGKLQLVHAYHKAAETRRLLETRLDADDALSLDFCATIQELGRTQLHSGWRIWCAERHMEWQYISPWASGTLLGLQTSQCVTPGLTYGYAPGTTRSHISIRNNHASLHKRLSPCTDGSKSSCLARIGRIPIALRARTPTSAGMERIQNDVSLPGEWQAAQPTLWRAVPTIFGIQQDTLTRTRSELARNMPFIVQDAIRGQCTKGHSCKESSKLLLESILNATITR